MATLLISPERALELCRQFNIPALIGQEKTLRQIDGRLAHPAYAHRPELVEQLLQLRDFVVSTL